MSAQVQPISIVQGGGDGGRGAITSTASGGRNKNIHPRAATSAKLVDNKGRTLPTLPGATSKKLASTADKYKEAQAKLFSKMSSPAAGKAPPDAPKAKTIEEVLEEGVDVLDDDDEIELTSLAPTPHIDVMVQKQEHRLDKLEAIIAKRVAVWTWKHLAAVVGVMWFTTILLGVTIGKS